MKTETTLKIGTKEFSVTSEEKMVMGRKEVVYELMGRRGARYFTKRNFHKPEFMFLCDARAGGIAMSFQKTWLTDKDGTLKVVERGTLKMMGQ